MTMGTTKVLIFLTAFLLIVVYIQCAPSDPATSAKVRQTRGFRNSALATARGFGKRTFLHGLPMAERSAVATSWLAEQMSNNPDFAQFIVERFVDTDGDGMINIDELLHEL